MGASLCGVPLIDYGFLVVGSITSSAGAVCVITAIMPPESILFTTQDIYHPHRFHLQLLHLLTALALNYRAIPARDNFTQLRDFDLLSHPK